MPEAAIPKLIPARDVAAATGLSVWRVYELARQGVLPHRKLGRSIWFTEVAVAAFLSASTRPQDPAANGR